LITGASRGIGRAIAVRLAAPGRLLLLHGRDREALEETCRLVRAKGGEAIEIVADLSAASGVDDIVAQVGRESLDLLVNNAGVTAVAPLDKITLEQWHETLAVNVTAPFLLIRNLIPSMNPGAAIVNILSVAAKTVFPGWSVYCMSKFALDGFSRAVREELRPMGIRVINVYPAATATSLWKSVPGTWSFDAMLPPEEIAEAIAYALERPSDVLVDTISLGNLAGNQ